MSLKILGGRFRGRILVTPNIETTRPTLAILRKAVFDILQTQIEDAHVLDLYAGSGAMGFEALSRGAAAATFVETNTRAFSCIKKNVETLGVEKESTLVSYDALLFLKKLGKEKISFDLIYVDPPYALGARLQLLDEILLFIDTHSLLKEGGKLFLEEGAPAKLHPSDMKLESLYFVNSRTFSQSTLHQFQKFNH
jgi:16S rRNA (guanine966-N2)-methyltransferase